jgi:ABC-type amino acid transport substrate-binding protein
VHRACVRGLLWLGLATAACGLPRDPEGTLDRLHATGLLRAGAVPNPPWVIVRGGAVSGPEAAIVEAFAARHGAAVTWVVGAEERLVERLEERELDLVVGGFTQRNPSLSRASASRPLYESSPGKRHVVLVAPGENGFLLALDRAVLAARDELGRLPGAATP